MTQSEKDKIQELRLKGYSYKTIAEKLNLSENTISSFCRRNKLIASKITNNTTHCKECGKPLEGIETRKAKSFCSDKCRYAWWNRNRQSKPGQNKSIAICKHCGKEYNCYGNPKRKYCTHDCYTADRFHKEVDANE